MTPAAIRHLLTSRLSGAVNLVGPTPATSDRITRHLATGMRRTYGLTAPAWAIKLAMQDAGPELLLSSQRVLPLQLQGDGFAFRHETAEQAIDALLDGRRGRS
jgi:NAD dependent epimerase/dehydratase family enzyme